MAHIWEFEIIINIKFIFRLKTDDKRLKILKYEFK